ncbi:phospholipase A(2) [Chlorella sorokiniana]|uniref:Phospholipase A(2) n=1 Tax=Chlorella sorokiniana TaxID=3076 RepID=A0A2P6TPW6_CHLSO|nr:phospholipase A(2) [Chlorella sorokiniana]|eukprot:PRW56075.1 phospholipase A(2) [Chlorella sorokiniana]
MSTRRFHSPAKALLVALVSAALVAAGAAPVREQGHKAAAAAAALSRRNLRGMESSIATPAGGNLTTKGLAEIVDSVLTGAANAWTYGVENLAEHFSGKCNYGNWCGEDCMGKKGTPIDTLDEHCETHDKCLALETDSCLRCMCHVNLLQSIDQMLADKGCAIDSSNWASDSCQSDESVKEAPTIAMGIQYRMSQDSCDSYAWKDSCNTAPASDNYNSEAMYRYEVTIGTSCNSGAGTDGYVQAKFTDETGAYISTGDLDNSGNDRQTCSVDTYAVGLFKTKVLMNGNTKLEVYFRPAGLFPDWEPEYVQVVRDDGSDAVSAKFCSSGVIAQEGWSSAASAAAAAAAVTRRGLRGIETSVELDNNVTTKGFSESVDSFVTSLGNDLTYGLSNVFEETTATKVLMNCDTTCQVYFKPKWAFPDWQPEYVRVSRSSNNDQTYSVRYCMDGILSEEGWYTFYCCD